MWHAHYKRLGAAFNKQDTAHTDRFFCRKELREKVGVKVRFIESAYTDRTFYRRQNIGTTLRFLSECHLADTARFFIGAIVCDNGRRGPIVCLRH